MQRERWISKDICSNGIRGKVMKKYDVTALGELLVDFTDYGISGQGNRLFEANPGGAPCNVLAMLSKWGKTCAFIGKVGNDFLGDMLKNALEETGIDTEGLVRDSYYNTTLAFVKNREGGDREFSFYRKPGADMMLMEEEISLNLITDARIFHFGTLSMTDKQVRAATKKAVCCAKENKVLCSFDPNLREALWSELQSAKEQILYGLSQCDILKISDNELEFVTGETDYMKGIRMLREQFPDIQLITYTAGAEGSHVFWKELHVYCPSFLLGGTTETTGAGDTFAGCVLSYILDHGLKNLSENDLKDMLRTANAAAYLITTKRGALRVMPEKEAVLDILRKE